MLKIEGRSYRAHRAQQPAPARQGLQSSEAASHTRRREYLGLFSVRAKNPTQAISMLPGAPCRESI